MCAAETPSFFLIHPHDPSYTPIYTETICASLESSDGDTSGGWLDGGEGGTVVGDDGMVGPAALSSVVGGSWLDGRIAGVIGPLSSVGVGLVDGGGGIVCSFCSVGIGLDGGAGIVGSLSFVGSVL